MNVRTKDIVERCRDKLRDASELVESLVEELEKISELKDIYEERAEHWKKKANEKD